MYRIYAVKNTRYAQFEASSLLEAFTSTSRLRAEGWTVKVAL